MNIELITKVIIPFLVGILVYVIVPFFKAKTTKEERELIFGLVKSAVFAAEQVFKYNYESTGKDKKDFVIEYLEDKGLDISEEDLDILIESAVHELNIAKGSVLNE